MTETLDAADDEVYVRLTGDERRALVSALNVSLFQCNVEIKRLREIGDPLALQIIEQTRLHMRDVRRVLAKVSE